MSNSQLDLNLGIDFGTQFTKVCIRDTALERSWVVTFANVNNSTRLLDQALLPTKVCICSDGSLLAGLTKSEWQQQEQTFSVAIDYIKMRLANIDMTDEDEQYPSDLLQSFAGSDLNNPENLENICAYYLGCVIIKAKQWFCENHVDLIKNQDINWSANVGVPVKYCDSPSQERFQKALCLALLLSDSLPSTFSQLKAAMQELRTKIPDANIPCFAIPELAAGVYSYTVSRQAKPGLYIFFDIGSGTIEGASFRFWRENEMPKIDFYVGEVEPLGVNALAKSINSILSDVSIQVEADIVYKSEVLLQNIQNLSTILVNSNSIENGEFISNQFKITDKVVEKQLLNNITLQEKKILHLILRQGSIHRQVAKVVMISIGKNRQNSHQSFNDSDLVIFLGGGGRESQYYQQTIKSTYVAFNHQDAGVPAYKVQELPFPKDDLDMSGIEKNKFHRFAVAYGLSIPDYQAPEFKLPSKFPYQPPQRMERTVPSSCLLGPYPDDNSSM